jgi:hypothetical protein
MITQIKKPADRPASTDQGLAKRNSEIASACEGYTTAQQWQVPQNQNRRYAAILGITTAPDIQTPRPPIVFGGALWVNTASGGGLTWAQKVLWNKIFGG